VQNFFLVSNKILHDINFRTLNRKLTIGMCTTTCECWGVRFPLSVVCALVAVLLVCCDEIKKEKMETN